LLFSSGRLQEGNIRCFFRPGHFRKEIYVAFFVRETPGRFCTSYNFVRNGSGRFCTSYNFVLNGSGRFCTTYNFVRNGSGLLRYVCNDGTRLLIRPIDLRRTSFLLSPELTASNFVPQLTASNFVSQCQ
jgi:hypothetical protein